MSTAKLRIPRAAAAVLVLGGAACGDDDDDGSYRARFEALTKASCEQYAECDRDSFDQYYDDIAECVRVDGDEFSEYEALEDDAAGRACLDAVLAAWNCELSLTCEQYNEGDPACAAQDTKAETLCAPFGQDASESYAQDAVTRPRARPFSRLRIPR